MEETKKYQQEILWIMAQYLRERQCAKAAIAYDIFKLTVSVEKEGNFLNVAHLKQLVIDGKAQKAQKYLTNFCTIDSDSATIFLELKKQELIEKLLQLVKLTK